VRGRSPTPRPIRRFPGQGYSTRWPQPPIRDSRNAEARLRPSLRRPRRCEAQASDSDTAILTGTGKRCMNTASNGRRNLWRLRDRCCGLRSIRRTHWVASVAAGIFIDRRYGIWPIATGHRQEVSDGGG
jgi:hypothetical protein